MMLDIDDGVPDFTARPKPAAARLSLGDWLPRLRFWHWRAPKKDGRHRAVSRHLDRMSDHTLRDIGLNRSEIKMLGRDLSPGRER
jgi:uncharacterized protein YjiS (DUF1127 family)